MHKRLFFVAESAKTPILAQEPTPSFPPDLIPGTFLPKRNMANDYLLDREI